MFTNSTKHTVLALVFGLLTGTSHAAPADHSAAVTLPNGHVLATGGRVDGHASGNLRANAAALPVALQRARYDHTATLLPDGRVLIWGGVDDAGKLVTTGEWFDPATGALSPATDIALVPRAGHSATVLTDGRLLVIGGHSGTLGALPEAELWDWRTNRSELLRDVLTPPRHGHSATLLADGRVLIRDDQHGTALYEPSRVRFVTAPGEVADSESGVPRIAASLPAANADNVAIDALIALRFTPPLDPASLSDATVTLQGPHGLTPIRAVPAEAGRLLFVTPQQDLFPGSAYTLFVNGARDAKGGNLPFTALEFRTQSFVPANADPRAQALPGGEEGSPSTLNSVATATAVGGKPRPETPLTLKEALAKGEPARIAIPYHLAKASAKDPDIWIPTDENLDGRWRTGRDLPPDVREAQILSLSQNTRDTAFRKRQLRESGREVTGQVLGYSDRPLAGVRVRIGAFTTQTDGEGRYRLHGVPGGHQELHVDGSKVGKDGDSYGQFVLGIEVDATRQTPVKPVYLPKIRQQDWIALPSPLTADMVVKSPLMPGLELRLPAGTILRDRDGKVIHRIALVPLPLDRSAVDFPSNTPIHMSLQPGNARIEGLKPGLTPGIQVIYPNYEGRAPGTYAEFLNYDPANKGWFTYGGGRVSADGKQVIPEANTAVYTTAGFSLGFGPLLPAKTMPGTCPVLDGDPVDLRTGVFLHHSQGPSLSDVIPIDFTTTHRSEDHTSRDVGKGGQHSYSLYFYNPNFSAADLDVKLSTLYLVRGDCSWVDFQLQGSMNGNVLNYRGLHTSTPSAFYGATLRYVNGQWLLTMRDGTTMEFSHAHAALTRMTDKFGRSLEITRTGGGQVSRITSPSGRYIDVFQDGQNRLKEVTDMAKKTWKYFYNAAGYLEEIVYPDQTNEHIFYNAQNRAERVRDRRLATMVTNVYDEEGRVKHQDLAEGLTFDFAYTSNAGVITETTVTRPNRAIRRVRFHPTGVPMEDVEALGTPLERKVTYERNAAGFPTAVTDVLGRRTEIVYNADMLPETITALAGTPKAQTTRVTYTEFLDVETVTDTLHHTTTYKYDLRRRLLSVRDYRGREVSYRYGARDLVETVTLPESRTISLGYDVYDLSRVTDPLQRTSRRMIDALGRTRAVDDPLHRRSEWDYDVEGNVVEFRDPAGGVTTLRYDARGNLIELIDPKQSKTTWTYDHQQRLKSRTDAMRKTESWAYAPDLSWMTHTDRMQRTFRTEFDALRRATKSFRPDGAQQERLYDIGDRIEHIIDTADGNLDYTYNEFDQVTTETTADGSIVYGYDDLGRLRTTQPSGLPTTSYDYDPFERLETITQGSEVVRFGYDNLDRRTDVTLPNGIRTHSVFDAASQLTALQYLKGATQIGDLTYGYDSAGQLIEQGGSWAETLLPDASNSLSGTNANHALTTFGGQAVTHDANGNMTGDGASEYVYDVQNRLVEIRAQGVTTATFRYDAVGRRTSRTVDGQNLAYRYEGANPVSIAAGGVTTTILNGLGIDERYAIDDVGGRRYFLTDHLGTSIALAGSSGEIATRYRYGAYGDVQSENVAGTPSTNVFQYTGRENDNNGLYYYRARYYSPTARRFIAEDPLGFVDAP
ncbi:RHS repeat-associated core domain-containing protein [Tahibacter amnicola]|uniref:Ig-like domain-containing protein n=1 Tax=Tahibacter amnicola TaxID=2976241 RepID=A0ABY6BF92_9GAMM|nr:RHS repeat-associated core domain-containing protein [Tahibacter amnicola]UXI68266.1 Ig-like domain-containing protein [Tahibacter amnicola]